MHPSGQKKREARAARASLTDRSPRLPATLWRFSGRSLNVQHGDRHLLRSFALPLLLRQLPEMFLKFENGRTAGHRRSRSEGSETDHAKNQQRAFSKDRRRSNAFHSADHVRTALTAF